MKYLYLILTLSACFLFTKAAIASGQFTVSSHLDAGKGSLRAALASEADLILIPRNIGSIQILQPLIFEGTQPLIIKGTGQTIDARGLNPDSDIITVNSGANVQISHLSIVGNASSFNSKPKSTSSGRGLVIKIPQDQSTEVQIALSHFTLSNVYGHGVHISDCSLNTACGNGGDASGNGSAASIGLTLEDVTITDLGFGKQDADGVRIDERGEGSISLNVTNSHFSHIGADGMELDEAGPGDVNVELSHTTFERNGEYCALVPFKQGSDCDDDGDADLDDGFDIDEAGPGSLYAKISQTRVIKNFDEGLDFDELGPGDMQIELDHVYALSNKDEGIKLTEDGAGNLHAQLNFITSIDNNGKKEAIEIRESSIGNLDAEIQDSSLLGVHESLKVSQNGKGYGRLTLDNSTVEVLKLNGVSSHKK